MGCSIDEGPKTGSASYDPATDELTLRGAGQGIGQSFGKADQGYFLSQPVEGDVQITVRLLARPKGASDFWTAGPMIRESLDDGARMQMMAVRSFVLTRDWRESTNGFVFGSLFTIPGVMFPVPVVLQLTRRGDTITLAYSTDDGKTFRAGRAITFTPPLAKTLYVGLVTSGGTSIPPNAPRDRISETKFSNLQIKKL
jgi:hypothetical protein